MNDTELLREALLDLERAREREQQQRLESETLLEGLTVISRTDGLRNTFRELAEVLRRVIPFQQGLLVRPTEDGVLEPLTVTSSSLSGCRWPARGIFLRVLNGQPAAIFDLGLVPEWQAGAPAAFKQGSALLMALQGINERALAVLCHNQKGVFSQPHLKLARRFTPLASQALRQAQLQSTLEERDRFFTLSLDMMGIIGFDGYFRQVNSAWSRVTGFSDEELKSRPAKDFFHPDDLQVPLELSRQAQERGETVRFEVRHRTRSGDYCWLLMSFTGFLEQRLSYVMAQDIHQLKMAEQALRESEERYALAARGANDGLWDWDLTTNTILYSSRWKSMLGFSEHALSSSPQEWLSRVHPDDQQMLQLSLQSYLASGEGPWQCEYRMACHDGSWRWILSRGLVVRDSHGNPCRMVGSQSDIMERKLAETRLAHAAAHDSLTGLANRASFLDRLRFVMSMARLSAEYSYAVLFLDLDRFKVVNDSQGHQEGDRLLQVAARRIQHCIRESDLVARLGGDEFVVLLLRVNDDAGAIQVAERILQEIKLPLELDGWTYYPSASLGVTFGHARYEQPEELLRDADAAMYQAKASHRGSYVIFEEHHHQRALSELVLDRELRQAIERRELKVFYQPIVSLPQGRLAGFEALARWRHPTRGLLGPDAFLPFAEQTGLICQVGHYVLEESCRTLARWIEHLPKEAIPFVSVNLAARQLATPDLVDEVRAILQETGLPPSALRLELTESSLIENATLTRATLVGLRALGLRISLDDFGTGYSSLAYLQLFPIDTLKIDRSFVTPLSAADANPAIIRAILALADALGMQVVAEGIETDDQRLRLARMGCHYGQGYLFARPLDEEQAEACLLHSWPPALTLVRKPVHHRRIGRSRHARGPR